MNPAIRAGLAETYGHMPDAQSIFDAVLALLSAGSYSTRFAHDLEDDFPHVPFPASHADFENAARIGARIRKLEGFNERPSAGYHSARLEGDAGDRTLGILSPGQAWSGDDNLGSVSLTNDQNLRMVGVSRRVWDFSVSGYKLLYKWLKARAGEPLHGQRGVALLQEALDVAWRIEELLSLFTEADRVLARVLDNTLTRGELNLPARTGAGPIEADNDAE